MTATLETTVESAGTPPVRFGDLLECLTEKQQYDRLRYQKNRKEILQKSRMRNPPKTREKICVVCGEKFLCGGANATKSPKAITCSDECKKKHKSLFNAEYVKKHYDHVREVDNENHRKKRKAPEYRTREGAKNRDRNKTYRRDKSWRDRANEKSKMWRREYHKTDAYKTYVENHRPAARANTQRCRLRKIQTSRLMESLAIAGLIKTEPQN